MTVRIFLNTFLTTFQIQNFMNKRQGLETSLSKINVAKLSDDQLEAIEKIINNRDGKKKTPSKKASANEMETSLQNIMMVMKPFAVAITDIKGCVVMKNETMNALLGDAFSEKMCIFNNKLFIKEAGKEEMKKLKTGSTIHIEELWYEKETALNETTKICVHALIFPLFNGTGSITNFVIIHVDITRHKLAEKAWKDTEEKFNLVFENNMQAVFYECDMDGKILDMSPSIEFISKYKREELIGNHMQDIYFNPKDREELMKELKTRKRLFDYLVKVKDKDGKVLHISVNTKLISDNKGNPKKVMGVITDVTPLHKTSVALKYSEERYYELFEIINDMIITMDLEGNFTSMNPAAEKLIGYKFEDLPNRKMASYLSPRTGKLAFENIKAKLKGEKANTIYEVDVVNKDGSYTTLEINSQLRYKDGKPYEIFGIARNVTDRKKANEALTKSEERYRGIVENAYDSIIIVDMEGKALSVNPAAEKMFGYPPGELLGKNLKEYLSDESKKIAAINTEKKLKEEKLRSIYEVDFRNKDGSFTSLEVNIHFRYKDGVPFETIGIGRNITERKKASEELKKSETKYKQIFENAPLGIMTADIEGNLIEINPTLLQLLGSQSLEQTRNINVLTFPPLIKAGFVAAFKRCIKSGKEVTVESSYTSKWGVQLEAKIYVKPRKDQKGKVVGFQTIVEDISEQKKADRKIKSALAEKEILIREIHHRVKNNMQVIISLINMQTYNSKDKQMNSKLKELQQRVRTMSIIHEDLYRSDDLAKINFEEYLNKLAENILQIYPCEFKIDLKFDIANIFLDINTAIPCGLIVNELLTNSFKHAFPEKWREKQKKKKFEIYIEFRSTKNHYCMVVGDNGIGISENNNNSKKDTLGLELVTILVGQMRGTMTKVNKNGTRYKIEIEKNGRT